MHPTPNLILTLSVILISTSYLFIAALSFLQFLPETGREKKTEKAVKIPKIVIGLVLTNIGLVGIATMHPELILACVGLTIGTAIQAICLKKKRKTLEKEIIENHQDEALISLTLGTSDNTTKGTALRIWFKRNKNGWPPLELEIGAGIFSLPIGKAPTAMMGELILPRIEAAFSQKETEEIFSKMKSNLTDMGVTHAIDIKGWDYNPIIQEMIERIMASPNGAKPT